MTDYMSRFGAVTDAGSEQVLDFGAIDPRAAMQSHRTGDRPNSTVVFHAADDVTGTVTPKLQDSEDGGTFRDLAAGQPVENPKRGNFAMLAMPLKHARYVRAIIAGDGDGITAFLEPGANRDGK
jgi:hypothetical protein